MRDRGELQEFLLTTQNSTLSQQLADVQKHVAIICRLVTQYCGMLSSYIESDFQHFFRRFIASAQENVHIHREENQRPSH